MATLISNVGAGWFWRVQKGSATYEGVEPSFLAALGAQREAIALTGKEKL